MKEKTQLYAILLMAGNSIRFGGNKLLSLVDNKRMYEYILDLVLKCRELFADIILVTQYDEIEKSVDNDLVTVVRNHYSERGISSSIQLGLSAIPEEGEQAYLFLVGDQPWLTENTIKGLIAEWKSSQKGIGCVCSHGKLGNPVIFSSLYRGELMELSGDKGGKRVLYHHKEDVCYYHVKEEKELNDIDYKPTAD